MRQVMVRYRVKPEHAAANEALVRAVYEELAQTQPDGLQYATYKLDDGVSFVRVAAATCSPRSPRSSASRRTSASAATSRRWSRS
jgi:hypothetical protein